MLSEGSSTTVTRDPRKEFPMDPTQTRIHVRHRIDALAEEARVERLAAIQRRAHGDEHVAHPSLDDVERHPAGGVRGTVGRALIELGSVIAGPDARHA